MSDKVAYRAGVNGFGNWCVWAVHDDGRYDVVCHAVAGPAGEPAAAGIAAALNREPAFSAQVAALRAVQPVLHGLVDADADNSPELRAIKARVDAAVAGAM